MTWLLGDDGLESTSTSPDTRRQADASVAACDSGIAAEPADRRRVRAGTRTPPPPADAGTLVDLALEELIGSASPLANLPTETDVDVLIEMLRASPASTKTASHASTVSINDILDNDPDLEASAVDLDPSLSSLLFDDVELLGGGGGGRRAAGKSVAFRNTDRRGFAFGFGPLGGDRTVDDDSGQLRTAGMPDDTARERKCVDETVKLEPMAMKDVGEFGRLPDASTADDFSPEDIVTCSHEHDGASPVVVHPITTQDLVSRRNTSIYTAPVSRDSDNSGEGVRPRSPVELSYRLEQSETVAVEQNDRRRQLETAAEPIHAVSSPEDEFSGFSSDTTCRYVEPAERTLVDVDGQSAMKSSASEAAGKESEKSVAARQESALARLEDIVRDRRPAAEETTDSSLQRSERDREEEQSAVTSAASDLLGEPEHEAAEASDKQDSERLQPGSEEPDESATTRRDSSLHRLDDVVEDRPSSRVRPIPRGRSLDGKTAANEEVPVGNSGLQPAARRRSLDWKPATGEEVATSVADVGTDKVTALTAYFEEVHAVQCSGCEVCLGGNVRRPFAVPRRRASLPARAGTDFEPTGKPSTTGDRRNQLSTQAGATRTLALVEPGYRNVDELPTDATPLGSVPLLDSADSDSRVEAIRASEAMSTSASGAGQTSTSLSASSVQTASAEQKNDHLSNDSRPESSLTAAESDGEASRKAGASDPGPMSSRRVVSLPDVYGESSGAARRSPGRAGATAKEFRFRLARVRSHSLRSFNELAVSGIARRPTTNRRFESADDRPSDHHSRCSAEQEKSSRKLDGVDSRPAAAKSTDSRQAASAVNSQPGTISSAEQLKSAHRAGTADSASLDYILAELCSPSATGRRTEPDDGSLTADMIRKYRIEPRRRRRGVGRSWAQEGNPGLVAGEEDEVVARKHGALERRIDAMLTTTEADRRSCDYDDKLPRYSEDGRRLQKTRSSEDDGRLPRRAVGAAGVGSGVVRRVPRTTATLPSLPDDDLPYAQRPVSNFSRHSTFCYRQVLILSVFVTARRCASAGTIAAALCLSVCHKSVFY